MSASAFEKDGLTFRRATQDDIPKILAFVDIYLRKDWLVRRAYLVDKMQNDETWVVFDAERLVAWATLGNQKRRGLWNLLVHPHYRGRHIGSNLVAHLRPSYIRSKADQSTGDPTAFYEHLGYEVIERNMGRKHNINLMRKKAKTESGKVMPNE